MRRLVVLIAVVGLVAVATPVPAQEFEPHPHELGLE